MIDEESVAGYRKQWNREQSEFKEVLLGFKDHEGSIKLFLRQHARHHTAAMAGSEPWSFEDEIFEDLSEDAVRLVPDGEEHSIAWLIWHIARIEDVTMNILLADQGQVLAKDGFPERMRISIRDTGNGMTLDEIIDLSSTIKIEALREYRLVVGRSTREIIKDLKPAQMKEMVQPERIQRIMDEGAVSERSMGLLDYWGRKNTAGLLLMPPTRHCFVHLNEAESVKKKAMKQLSSRE